MSALVPYLPLILLLVGLPLSLASLWQDARRFPYIARMIARQIEEI